MEVWNQHKKYDDDTCDILGCLVLFITSYDIIYVSVKVYKFDYRKFVMKWSDLHLKKSSMHYACICPIFVFMTPSPKVVEETLFWSFLVFCLFTVLMF